MDSTPAIAVDFKMLSKWEQRQVNSLQQYIENGDHNAVENLVKELKGEVDLLKGPRYPNKDYPLHFAARKTCRKIVELLGSACPEAVIQTNGLCETPIHIAIESGELQLVIEMFPHFRSQIIDKKQEFLPGKPLVHAVLERHWEGNWEGYLDVLFGYNVGSQELSPEEDDNKSLKKKLKKKLMDTCINKTQESPLYWFINLEKDKEKKQTVAINVADKYPELMNVKDPNGDIAIHQAFKRVIKYSNSSMLNFVKKAIELEERNFHLGTDRDGKNILHLLASDIEYCKKDKNDENGIFKSLTKVNDIYNHVRQKGKYKSSPLELAAENSNNEEQPKTNDKFIEFSISDVRPTT